MEDFREFAQARLSRLSTVAYLLTGDHHAAEDLLQIALEKVAQHWRRISAMDSPDAYVRRMLYNEHVSMWRRRRMEVCTDRLPEMPGADEDDRALRRVMTQQALAKLTPRQRAVIVLRYFEDLSVSDTAQSRGCSEGTVMRHT